MKNITSKQLKSLYETCTVKSAAEFLGISRQHFYRLLKWNDIPLKGHGKKIFVINE